MEDTGPHRIRLDDWISCAPFERLLRIEIVSAQAGRAVLTMPFCRDLAQGAGLMHGGALVTLADTAVVMAIKSLVAPATHFATIAMESRFLHPVTQGRVTARAEIVERHDRLLRGRALVEDDQGRAVLDFSSTFKIARDRVIGGAAGRDRGAAAPTGR